MSVEAAAHTHSRHRDYGVARDLDVLIGQAGRHEPHSLKPRRAPPTRHHPNAPVVILIPRNARAPERAGGSISCGPKFTNIHGEHQPFWKSRSLGRVNHWSLVASNRLKALPQIDAVIQRLLPLLIARCLIQNRRHATDQQAKGVTRGEPVQHLDHLRDLGWIHRAAPQRLGARQRSALMVPPPHFW